jgi:hypothetical protein
MEFVVAYCTSQLRYQKQRKLENDKTISITLRAPLYKAVQ